MLGSKGNSHHCCDAQPAEQLHLQPWNVLQKLAQHIASTPGFRHYAAAVVYSTASYSKNSNADGLVSAAVRSAIIEFNYVYSQCALHLYAARHVRYTSTVHSNTGRQTAQAKP